jgi:hypothetical protein
MDGSVKATQIARAMQAGKYKELSEVVHLARLRLSATRSVEDECASVCESLMSAAEKYLRALEMQGNDTNDPMRGTVTYKPYFEVWYALGAVGLVDEDVASL